MRHVKILSVIALAAVGLGGGTTSPAAASEQPSKSTHVLGESSTTGEPYPACSWSATAECAHVQLRNRLGQTHCFRMYLPSGFHDYTIDQGYFARLGELQRGTHVLFTIYATNSHCGGTVLKHDSFTVEGYVNPYDGIMEVVAD